MPQHDKRSAKSMRRLQSSKRNERAKRRKQMPNFKPRKSNSRMESVLQTSKLIAMSKQKTPSCNDVSKSREHRPNWNVDVQKTWCMPRLTVNLPSKRQTPSIMRRTRMLMVFCTSKSKMLKLGTLRPPRVLMRHCTSRSKKLMSESPHLR